MKVSQKSDGLCTADQHKPKYFVTPVSAQNHTQQAFVQYKKSLNQESPKPTPKGVGVSAPASQSWLSKNQDTNTRLTVVC
jgi:hypothetical protein